MSNLNQPYHKEVMTEALDWARKHRDVLPLVYERFDRSGTWPELPSITRDLVRSGADHRGLEDLNSMPHELGYVESGSQRIVLRPLALSLIPGARGLLHNLVMAVQLAVARYRGADELPTLSSANLQDELLLDDLDLTKLGVVLTNEPLLFSGGTGDPETGEWQRNVWDRIAEFVNVRSIDDYLERQAAVLNPRPPVVPTPSPGLYAGWAGSDNPLVMTTQRDGGSVLTTEDLHPLVATACSKLFADGHYSEGVLKGARALRDLVRKRSGLTKLDGNDLFGAALGGDAPRLVVADLQTETGKNVQRGTLLLAQGVWASIRNPHTHDSVEVSPAAAMEMAAAISLIVRRVGSGRRPRKSARPKPPPRQQ